MWVCVLQRGQRGEGWCVSSTLCRYDIRMRLLLVLNWARGATCFSGEGRVLKGGDLRGVLVY